MHSKNFVYLLLVGTGIFFSSYLHSDEGRDVSEKKEVSSLCDTGDIILFTCTTGNKKIISLCQKGTIEKTTGVYYRFGRKNKIEMDFPEIKDESSIQLFTVEKRRNDEMDVIAIDFDNNDYSYFLYDIKAVDKTVASDSQGVKVIKVMKSGSAKILADIKCSSGYAVNVLPE